MAINTLEEFQAASREEKDAEIETRLNSMREQVRLKSRIELAIELLNKLEEDPDLDVADFLAEVVAHGLVDLLIAR